MSTAVRHSVWKRAQSGHLESWAEYARRGTGTAPERREVWNSILAEVEKCSPIRAGERILDIGCGLDTALDFVEVLVLGFTVDTLAAELSALGLSPHARHTAGALENLPYRDASFDRVMLMNVLDHVRDARWGLRETARVLRPGGALVLSLDTYSGRRYHAKRLHKWWARARGATTKHPLIFSTPSAERLLRESGFDCPDSLHVPGTKARRTLFIARRR